MRISDSCRYWNGEKWVYPTEVLTALDAARLAIEEYYNGDREWAESWLMKAYEANQDQKK